ncbi:MAG TPA: hypothetical protein VFM12_04405 [Gemmatimonadales bacterium]|jgi:hypothetical protein|nr:hypothetical protein [Gemmatimonadales bacterium]
MRTREYFGFDLDVDTKQLEGNFPPEWRDSALDALAAALLAGETVHPAQGTLRRAAEKLDEYWRRSGGTLSAIAPAQLQRILRGELEAEGVKSWETFIRAGLALDVAALVDARTREQLDALPSSVRIKGDVVPLTYEIHNGQPAVRLTLREGQARRVRPGDLPTTDRRLLFAVRRGNHPPLLAESLEQLREGMDRRRKVEQTDRRTAGRGGHRRRRR